ncbi:DNA polymerase II [Alteromonas pelagimontana]|uniref:DNA polymerase n=1 Tax=Alteromonas pelagimontana TaxID=1858656 RepID=A0A6M4MLB0_9ALTE|nr:DNA polymerase II [Alteromonas pelagimontana]
MLTRRLIRQGNNECIELWLATKDGPRCVVSEPQTNVCFVRQEQLNAAQTAINSQSLSFSIENTHLKTLEQQPVTLLRPKNEHQLYQLRRYLNGSEVTLYEADIKLVDRFLMERFAYGAISYSAREQDEQGVLRHAKVKGATFRPQLSSLSVDIECDENETLFSIGIAGNSCNRVILIANAMSLPEAHSNHYQLQLVRDEQALLDAFEQAIREADPDVITGWNVKQFDMAVLARCAGKYNRQLKIGRHEQALSVREWEPGQVIVEVPGRSIIDGIEALKTMTYQFDSFALDNVAQTLTGRGKLIESENKLEAIKSLYRDNPAQLAAYNFQDCELVNDIATKTAFLDFMILRSTLTGLDMSRAGGSVAAFINVYLPKLHRAGFICGVRPSHGGLTSPGGYVMSSRPGLYENVLVLDFKSLYPSIIRTFKVDPLGLAEGLANPADAIAGFNGALFSRDKHFLPDIIANLWSQRDEAKRNKDAPRSQAIKILMNSFYGVLGSGGCPFYDPRLASSITLRGHEIMQTTAGWINAKGYEVIYGDTDSLFVHLPHVRHAQEAADIGKNLEKMINQSWRANLKDNSSLDCFLEIEFETHFHQFFMPTIRGAETGSKKRYAGMTMKNGNAQLLFKGLENVRSDWTPLAKQFQEALYTRIFTKQPVEHYVQDVLEQIRSGQKDKQLIYARRLRKPLSHYTKTMPPHVRAARAADEHNRQAGNVLKYQNKTTVFYVVTTHGPQTVEQQNQPLDYEHYIEKQIRPIAESILPSIGLSFDDLFNQQMGLFG